MLCPKCGGAMKVVPNSFYTKNTVERTRRCVNCATILFTKEVYVPDRTRLLSVERFKKAGSDPINFEFTEEFDGSISANQYQKNAWRTANSRLSNSSQLSNGLMGLNGEAGEAIDILKKHLYQGHELDKEHLAKELGDVAWYLAISAYALSYDLGTILQMNIAKLEERYPEKFYPELSINRKDGDI